MKKAVLLTAALITILSAGVYVNAEENIDGSVYISETGESESAAIIEEVPNESNDEKTAYVENPEINSQTTQNGFVDENGVTYYYQNGVKVLNKEIYLDNNWYYFDESGKMAVGWTTHHGHRYYYDANGKMVHGIYVIGGEKYGFDEWTGVLLSGEHHFTNTEDNDWYYFDENGKMAVGWITHHEHQYYYDNNGIMAHGIYKIGNTKYGFDEWTGVLLSGEHYFTDGSDDHWYYFSEDAKTKGQIKTGWINHHGNQYYYNEHGQMVHGIYKVGNIVYMFDEWLGIKRTGWVAYQGEWFYMDTNGSMYFGEHYMNGHWYYFDETTGITANKGLTKHHNHWYYYDENGYMQYGEKYIGTGWYYFNEYTGIMAIGWTNHHGNTYYYDENGQMVHGQVTIDGKKYIFDDVTGVLKGQARAYQNPSKYYQIKDYISLSGGGTI